MFKKILIANRGEIALRIISTCKEMGIETVSVYSDADVSALHTMSADQSFYIGESEPKKSYLNIESIIEVAKKTGAEAIHPGYGFLAENSSFAKKCEDEGIVFIGPPADVIESMGDKIRSRQIMDENNVPVTPGLISPETDPEALLNEAEKIGYPVMIKATAGGGGKGIRIVNSGTELKDAADAASREALSAFGNGEIYLEKFFKKAKHIEFQVLADKSGNCVHLFERECSIQRRHQKIIEEAPSTALTDDLRKKMGETAVKAAKAAGYVNAGTVEFLLDENNNFYFLEMNTRLQVEHPVTEMITGIDIVRKQIDIAWGKELDLNEENITKRGHSIECRIYAEDPEKDFIPSPGKINFLNEPKGPGIRNDCGVYSGAQVPFEYDPILSKLIVMAEGRADAIAKMEKALKEYAVFGVKTPVPFLLDIMKDPSFIDGEVYTDFIEKNFSKWECKLSDKRTAAVAFISDDISKDKKNSFAKSDKQPSPWQTLGNWR